MAEETDGFQSSNEANKSGGDSSLHQPVTVKRHATKKVPHYLRASTGSCHDACKYGHPHKTKDKPTRPVRRKISPLLDGEKMEDIQIFVDKKVQKATQSDKLDLPSVKESATSDGKLKKSVLLFAKSSISDSSTKLVKQEVRSSTKSPSSKVPKVINKAVQSSRKLSLPDTLKNSKQEVALAAKKSVFLKRIPLHPKERNAFLGDANGRGRVKQSPLLETLKKSNGEVASTTTIIEVSSKRTPLSSKKRNGSEEGILKASLSSQRTSKVETKKLLHPTTAAAAASKSLKLGQRPRNQAEAKEPPCSDQKVEEKTLHVIDKKQDDSSSNADLLIQSPSPLSPESLNSSSQTTSLSFTSHEIEDQRDMDSEYTDISSADSKAAVAHDSDDNLPMKLKFSKKAQSDSETNNLKRLQVGQGRTLGDDDSQGASSGAQRLSYMKKAADCNKEEADSGVVKVVLKHQEMETKKGEQVSLNSVIEETASKLVEKRKSKVKALVGAFESVISLHEQKPSAANR